MAKLLDLANELLLGIVSIIRVDDIEAFTACNRRIYGLSEDVLVKHRAMKKKYSRVHVQPKDGVRSVHFGVHPVTWLNEIVRDETVALYPTHLYIHQFRPVRNDHSWPWSESGTETKDLINLKLEKCSYIQRKELVSWKKDIDNWSVDFDKALALLLTLLPNLRAISTQGHREFPECTENMIVQIAKAHGVDEGQTHALSRLVSFHQTSGFRDNLLISTYLPFTCLPSIRSVSGDTVDGRSELYKGLPSIRDGFGDAEGKPKPFKSAITKIRFTQSRISSLAIEELLCRIGALQEFKYEDDCGRSPGFQPGKIVNSLLAHAGHSLRCLDLTGKVQDAFFEDWRTWECRWGEAYIDTDDYEGLVRRHYFIGSLRHFQVLTTIKVDCAMFVEMTQNTDTDGNIPSTPKVHRLVDLLPASVEKLALVTALFRYRSSGRVFDDLVKSTSRRMFDHLVESKAQVLPSLKEIKFHYLDPVVKDLKRACHETGVALVVATTS